MNNFLILTDKNIYGTSFRIQSVKLDGRQAVYKKVLIQGKKWYVPILPLTGGDRVGKVAWRSASQAERIHYNTKKLTKQRILNQLG